MTPSFGFETTGIEVVRTFVDQVRGRTFLITGPSQGGLGAETALSLAHGDPGLVILVGRSLSRCQPVIDAIHAVNSSLRVKFVDADLASNASVRKAAQQINADAEVSQLDVVINNAAVMACPFALTADGNELQLAADHLGHFLLTNLLMPKILKAGASIDDPAALGRGRIVNVSSSGNKYAGIRWSDPNFTAVGSYTPYEAYGQAKTANVLFTLGLNARVADRGLHAYALHPGSIRTNLQAHMTAEIAADAAERIFGGVEAAKSAARPKTLQQGCATTLRAALDPELPRREGVWLADCELADGDATFVAPWALDLADAERCWGWSEELVGEKFEYK